MQRCIDSSRFFAILLINEQTGQKANIGVQFTERNDSFDFVGALDKFRNYFRNAKGLDKPSSNHSENAGAPGKDFSLKEGEKITISIKGLGGDKSAE